MLIASLSQNGATLPEHFRAVVVCPVCRQDLEQTADGLVCQSSECGARYRFTGQIPVLADEDRSPVLFLGKGEDHADKAKMFRRRVLRSLPTLDRSIVPDSVKKRLAQEIFELSDRPVVLNVGGKHPTSLTDEICSRNDVNAIECDLAYRPRTRVLANPEQLPVSDSSVVSVFLDAILEHVPNPQEVVEEAWRVLKPDGILYSDTPFILQVHGGPFDYMRFGHQAQRWMFRRFDEIESGVSSGPGVALAYAFQYFLLSFATKNKGRYAATIFSRLTVFWLKYFDKFVAENPSALDGVHGLYFLVANPRPR